MTQGTFFEETECQHLRTEVVPEKRSSIHHAKLICSACHKFLKWLPSPETIKKAAENAKTLHDLAKREDLPEWERHFVRSVSGEKKLSPKQQVTLDDLRTRFLGR